MTTPLGPSSDSLRPVDLASTPLAQFADVHESVPREVAEVALDRPLRGRRIEPIGDAMDVEQVRRMATIVDRAADSLALARILDCLAEGVVLLRGDDVVYRNAAAARQLGNEGDALSAELHLLGRRALRGPGLTETGRVLASSGPRFLLRATRLRPDIGDDVPLVVVTIERTTATLPSPSVAMRQFNLTKREAGVALLVAQGHSNAHVASSLGISESTARHYTESVFLKLGVRTRAAAAAAILGAERRRERGRGRAS